MFATPIPESSGASGNSSLSLVPVYSGGLNSSAPMTVTSIGRSVNGKSTTISGDGVNTATETRNT